MDDPSIWRLLVLLILVLINAVFTMSEIAVITLNDNKIKRMADEGIAILMVTHDLDTTGYANIHYQMKDGILSAAN